MCPVFSEIRAGVLQGLAGLPETNVIKGLRTKAEDGSSLPCGPKAELHCQACMLLPLLLLLLLRPPPPTPRDALESSSNPVSSS